MSSKALFLDRDGIINRMVLHEDGFGPPRSPSQVKLISQIVPIIHFANQRKIQVFEVTNKPGVAKGRMDEKTNSEIEAKIHELLKIHGVFIDKVYACMHHPESIIPKFKVICECRKPEPGLLRQAIKEFNIDPKRSLFLGDKATDIKAGQAVGVKTILFLHQEDLPQKVTAAKESKPDFKSDNMKEIFLAIREFFDSIL